MRLNFCHWNAIHRNTIGYRKCCYYRKHKLTLSTPKYIQIPSLRDETSVASQMELPGRNFQTSARHPFCPVTSSGKLLYLCFSSNVCLHSLFGSYNLCMCTYSVWFTGTPFSAGALNCRRWEGRTQILSVQQPTFSSYFWRINLVQI